MGKGVHIVTVNDYLARRDSEWMGRLYRFLGMTVGVIQHELTDAQGLLDEIAEHCADEEGFIRTEMPVQEIVFRTLLARRNEPTPLLDLLYELTDRWATPVRPITLTEKGLARILDADTYYGFVRVTPGDE